MASLKSAFLPALGIAAGVSLASPAFAETTTLSCQGDAAVTGGPAWVTASPASPWSGSIDIDYAVGRVSVSYNGSSLISNAPAIITDKVIRFESYTSLLGSH